MNSLEPIGSIGPKKDLPAMRVIQVVASIASEASGLTYSVTRLAQSLASREVPTDLMSIGHPRRATDGHLRIQTFDHDLARVPVIRQLYLSRALDTALARAAADGALLHCHGLWLMPNIYPSWNARRYKNPLLHSPRGMLAAAALQFSPLKKKVFSVLAQRQALAAVDCFHATSQQELEEIRAFGLDGPVAVIPNGIDALPLEEAPRSREAAGRTALYLGRVHPIKGLDRLLQAWSKLETDHPDWRLRIVGPSQGGHREQLGHLAPSLGLRRVVFENGLYGKAKLVAYREADVFVLPTFSENFGMVVAEALVNGAPVISTKGAPWRGLVENGCGWWIDQGIEPLAAALADAMAMPSEALNAMGARGRAWMIRDFSWDRIATDMIEVYRWCAGLGGKPGMVVIER